jgi:hypothetical protein
LLVCLGHGCAPEDAESLCHQLPFARFVFGTPR